MVKVQNSQPPFPMKQVMNTRTKQKGGGGGGGGGGAWEMIKNKSQRSTHLNHYFKNHLTFGEINRSLLP